MPKNDDNFQEVYDNDEADDEEKNAKDIITIVNLVDMKDVSYKDPNVHAESDSYALDEEGKICDYLLFKS